MITSRFSGSYDTFTNINTFKAIILKLFEASGNSVVKSQVGALRKGPKNLLALALRALSALFGPLEGLSPFVVYCLHSNNSLKLFFENNFK